VTAGRGEHCWQREKGVVLRESQLGWILLDLPCPGLRVGNAFQSLPILPFDPLGEKPVLRIFFSFLQSKDKKGL
jgi:hypothetical protein